MTRAFVGIGSNLGDRAAAIDRAIAALGVSPGVRLLRASRVRETAPWGRADQPAYLNAAVEMETDLAPEALLDLLLGIEKDLGRVRDPADRWGPRLIDLDLLLYGDRRIATDRLTVPHPRLSERRFVVEPLCDLAPELVLPGERRPLSDLLETLTAG